MKPPRLRQGDTIGIVGPASPMIPERLQRGIAYLENRGFRIKKGKFINNVYGYLAGSDAERSDDFNLMFADPEVKAIFCTRGGYGTPRMLDLIDYDLIKNNPKIFVGYSDITALQLAIYRKTGLVTFSGPMAAVEMGKNIDTFTEEHFWELLSDRQPNYKMTGLDGHLHCVKPGKASGQLLGGCLSLLCSIIGTPFCPDFQNAILFIEDVGEQPYQIDRHLTQLRLAGILRQISGLVVGKFEDCEPQNDVPSLTIEQVLEDTTKELDIPILSGLPYGHIDVKYTLPVGAEAVLDSDGESLILNEPVVCA